MMTPRMVRLRRSADLLVKTAECVAFSGLAAAGLLPPASKEFLASSAPYVAVMDADLQHDEQLLPHMLDTLKTEPIVDAVVGSRYVEHGSIGTWSRHRAWLSSLATRIGRSILRVPIADPMSGFFMVRREAFQGSVRRLSSIGFKILLDILASSPRPLQVKEIPFHFRERHAGESKFDALIGWEYLMLKTLAGYEEVGVSGDTDPDKPATTIDKSVLAIPASRRYRDRDHLRHVAKHPCLICGRKPSDPHHLRFMQPRALGRKASDEFTVPLCRIHHRRSTASATRRPGGRTPASSRSWPPASCGKTRA